MADTAEVAWLRKVLGVELPQGGGGGGGGGGTAKAMAVWQVARGTALGQLTSLENAYRDMEEPEVNEAIILLRAIQANLTQAPETPQQVAELEHYITDDDIIAEAEEPNGFGFKVELREPLLAALAELKAAQGGGR
jgi:hypothetical protein